MPVLPEDGAFLQKPLGLGVVYHGLGYSVLDGTGRVEVLQLCHELCLQAELLFNMGQLQKRSLADKLICGSVYFRHDVISFILFVDYFLYNLYVRFIRVKVACANAAPVMRRC